MRWLFITVLFISLPTFAASSFKGFPKAAAEKSIEVKGKVINMTENNSEFLIGLEKQAAFFLFPKSDVDQISIRDFLAAAKSKKKILTLEVNPKNTKIYYMKSE